MIDVEKEVSKLYTYIDNVNNGNIVVGKTIKKAVKLFEKNLQRFDLEFRIEELKKYLVFASNLKHTIDKTAGNPFILEPWQVFIVASILCFYYKGTNKRKVKNVYVELARKQGKTFFMITIIIYLQSFETGSPQIVLAANSKEQVKDVDFKCLVDILNTLDPNQLGFKQFRNQITTKHNNGFLKIVSADTSKLDGANLSAFVIDEFHEAKDWKMYDVLKSSQLQRENPLRIIITTAGFNKNSPCYSMRQTCFEILEELKEDDTFFSAIYCLDNEDDWKDPEVWIKSNPNLGITVSKEAIQDEVNQAINNPALEVGTKTKTLNVWCDSITTWIPDTYVLESSKQLSFNDIPQDVSLYVGVDLSNVSDITAVSYNWQIDDKQYFINKYYLPVDSTNTATDKEQYKIWANQGFLTLTPGNVIDYEYILNDILTVNNQHFITELGYDNWNATQFATNSTAAGLNLSPVSQAIGHFSRSTKEFQRLLLMGNVVLDNNPITRWMLSNCYIKRDHNGNEKPDKSQCKNKIDGVIAMLMALNLYLLTPKFNPTLIF